MYPEKCIPLLQQFIKKYHQRDNIIFWTDLPSSHYAKSTLTELKARGIDQSSKRAASAAVRNIWGQFEKKYSKGYIAKNTDWLIQKIKKNLNKMDKIAIKNTES